MTKVSKSGEIVMKFEMLCDVNANFTEITPHLSRFFYFSRFFGKAASSLNDEKLTYTDQQIRRPSVSP